MTGYFGKIPSVESEKGSSGRASGGVGALTLEAHIVGGDPETAKKVRRSVETLGAASRDGSLKAHDTTQVGGEESQPLQRWKYVKQNIQRWEQNRKAEAERKAAYMANLKLPFVAEYGEHKAKQGDIYAVVVHTERHNPKSDFMVKYYTIKKHCGRLYVYRCNENGELIKTHGKAIYKTVITAYRKVV